MNRGYSTFQTNLLVIPSWFLFILNNLALSFASKYFNNRLGVAVLGSVWQLVCLIAVVCIPDDTNKWAKWALLSLVVAYPVCLLLPPRPFINAKENCGNGS